MLVPKTAELPASVTDADPLPVRVPVTTLLRTLVIDDDPDMVMVVETVLRTSDLPVEVIATASTVDDAIVLADRERPDVAIVDLGVPEPMDGVRLVARLRVVVPAARIVAYSAFDLRDAALAAGADAYVMKQGGPDDRLLAVIRELLEA